MHNGSLYDVTSCPGGLCAEGSLSRGFLSRGSLSRGGLCAGVSVQRVSVQQVSVQGGLCPEGGSLCRGRGPCPRGPLPMV